MSLRKNVPWIGHILHVSTHVSRLPHTQRGCPNGVVDITPYLSMWGDVGLNPTWEKSFSFISEMRVESRL